MHAPSLRRMRATGEGLGWPVPPLGARLPVALHER